MSQDQLFTPPDSSRSQSAGLKALWSMDGAESGGEVRPAHQNNPLPTVTLHDVQLANVTEAQCVRYVMGELDAGRGGWMVTPNLDIIRRLARDAWFRELVSEASLMVADGMPLVWASRLQGTPLPERVCGSDLITSLSEAAARGGRSIYLLGGDEGTAEAAADTLRERFADLRVAGTYYPPFGFERDEREMARIAENLRAARPDIVYVALGCPKQERLIRQLRPNLPHAWWVGVGVSFSFLCGEVRRAPEWMRKLGLEWVHRLSQEPERLMKRYVIDDIPFAIRLLGGAVRKRLAEKDSGRSPA